MVKMLRYRVTKPRGLAVVLKEPKNSFTDFYVSDASFYEEQLLACTYDMEVEGQWCGFISLVNSTLKLDKAERGIQEVMTRKNIPRMPPAILLAQLYICSLARGRKYGGEALRWVVDVGLRSPAACRLIVVDLDNEDIRSFYIKHGWITGPQTSSRMYLDLYLFKEFRSFIRRKYPGVTWTDELKFFADVQKELSSQGSLFHA